MEKYFYIMIQRLYLSLKLPVIYKTLKLYCFKLLQNAIQPAFFILLYQVCLFFYF